jgi:dTDP-4-amino-4,6-dideoxygalactose transaminase
MINIPIAKPDINEKDIKNVTKVLRSNWLTNGPITRSLEMLVSKKLNIKNVIAVNSCTSGILASIVAKGYSPGDEVITPANTFVSTIHTLHNLKLKIKLCDIDPLTLSTNENFFKERCTNKTKFFIPVHFGGNPLDISNLINLCNHRKIFLIDDAATALGSKINNEFIGSFKNNVTVFSLHANKTLTSGEGGLICLSDQKLANKIRYFINCGLEKSSWERFKLSKFKVLNSILPGYKLNYNDILASLATTQFERIEKIISNRKKKYERYEKNLLELINNRKLYLPSINVNSNSAFYCFQIVVKNKNIRSKLCNYLNTNGISTTVYYTPAHKHSFYKKIFEQQKKYLKNTDYVFDRSLALPFFNNIKNNEIDMICQLIIKFFKNV